ncbi:MAG: hypothetical protein HY814_02310 [Candidatus Riflebacteria bacterium]|nr:hypothetical protein [Candidatus Riflebacteria bacterium]
MVSWVSAASERGFVLAARTASDLANRTGTFQVYYDAREVESGMEVSDDKHYVELTGLSETTDYVFDIQSGTTIVNNGGAHFLQRTGVAQTGSPNTFTVAGRVKTSAGIEASHVLVYLQVTSGVNVSQTWAVLADSAGQFAFDLRSIYRQDASALFDIHTGDLLSIDIRGASDGSYNTGGNPLVLDTSLDFQVLDDITLVR